MSINNIEYDFQERHTCIMCGANETIFKIMGKRLNQSQGYRPQKKDGIYTKIYKCGKCGLIFSNPMPVPLDISSHYDIPPEYYWNEGYIKNSYQHSIALLNRIKKTIDIKPGFKSLDIGSGTGMFLRTMTDAGIDAYGIEPSYSFYNYATNNGISADKMIMKSVESVCFEKNTFDLIFIGSTLEHLYNPSEVLNKCIYWLKPEGYIYIQVPSSKWLTARIINAYYKATGSDFVTNLSPMHSPFHLFEFSLMSFVFNGKKNKYKVVKHNYITCKTYLPRILDFLIKPVMFMTKSGMELDLWLKKTDI